MYEENDILRVRYMVSGSNAALIGHLVRVVKIQDKYLFVEPLSDELRSITPTWPLRVMPKTSNGRERFEKI